MTHVEAERSESPAQHEPDLAIRTRPPSPKRLSRRVLLGGAIVLGAIVSAALLFGLNANPGHRVREADAIATAGGPGIDPSGAWTICGDRSARRRVERRAALER